MNSTAQSRGTDSAAVLIWWQSFLSLLWQSWYTHHCCALITDQIRSDWDFLFYPPSSLSVMGRLWSTHSSEWLSARPIPLLTIWPILVPMAPMIPPLTAARVISTPPLTASTTASLAPAIDWYTRPTVSDTTYGKSCLHTTASKEWWDQSKRMTVAAGSFFTFKILKIKAKVQSLTWFAGWWRTGKFSSILSKPFRAYSLTVATKKKKTETRGWNIKFLITFRSDVCFGFFFVSVEMCHCRSSRRKNLRWGSKMSSRGLDPVLAAAPSVRTPLSAASITPFSIGKLSLVLL